MKRSLKIFLAVLMLLSLPILAQAAVLYVAGSSVTFAWDDEQTDIELYEVLLIRDTTGIEYGPYTTTTKTIIINRPKSGKYEVRVRGRREGVYSEWHSSIDDNALLKTGTKGKWKVYFKLIGPTGPIIIY